MQSKTFVNRTKKKPATVKIADWSARHRWVMFGLWLLLMFGLAFGSSAIPASKNAYDPNSTLDLEFSKATSLMKANGGDNTVSEDFFLVVNSQTLKVTDPAYQTAVDSLLKTLAGYTYTEDGQTKPLFTQLVNPYQAPPQFGLISQDMTTLRVYGKITGETYTESMNKKMEPFQAKVDELKAQYPDFKVLVSSPSLNYLKDAKEAVESMGHSMLITLIPTFIILLLVFGAVVASVVPLVLAMTAITGAIGVVTIYSRITGDSNITNAYLLVPLMGLAVAVDYSLFIISRYRAERFHGRDKLTAIEVAAGTAGRAVFFSGVLVAISISGLFLLGGSLVSMALGIVAVVLLSVLGSFTFLPAVLSILGKGINWLRIPYFGRAREEGHGVWSVIIRGVMRRPVITSVIAVSLLLALAVPLLHIRLGISLPNSEKSEAVQVTKLLTEKWPQGTELKLSVVITNADKPETQAAIEKFKAAMLQIPGLSEPVQVQPTPNGQYVMLSFVQSGTWNDQANHDIVKKVREEVVPAYFKEVGAQAYVTGWAATVVDFNRFFTNPIVWLFVLGLSFVVLLVVFRSLVIATKAIFLNLLSTGAAYGAVILVFQDGWLGVKPTGVMQSYLPVFIFAIIFGLSMDYHMFILTRIKEFRDKGFSSNEAVARGISITSGTITGAAAIMVVVFGDFFVGIEEASIRQVGLGLAVAVFLDATIVRSLLLPALMRLMGEWNWWLPKFLNWLPTITIESEPEEEPATIPATPELVNVG